ncbi:negative elongation factor D [Aplysia californica]|uniref:Negative elongation factor D n=1 Tax=Aplysia californica TaxID=6500 RepID=A0ABM0JY07_APLCA|nr:negative elongation factor D [Aplysia californica]
MADTDDADYNSDEYPNSPSYDNRDNEVNEEEEEEDAEAVQAECLELFSQRDFIMESNVLSVLKRYLQAGGSPVTVVELLSANFTSLAGMVNVMANWLIQTGVPFSEVTTLVEQHLTGMVIKNFDPKKADSIFNSDGNMPEWLPEMIQHPTWRSLFYKLAEQYPDCLMLNFTIKMISDAGFQGEITSVSTACHQIEVFSRVLKTSVASFLSGGEEALTKHLPEFTKMVCHGEHTYLYSQLLMHLAAEDSQGGANMKRLCQELQKSAVEKGLDVTPITVALSHANEYPRACQALSSMLSRKALNPADITVLFKMYSDNEKAGPPVALIRVPEFLDLLIDALYNPSHRINPEHMSKYIYLLAYSVSVVESQRRGKNRRLNKEELKSTSQAIEKTHSLICRHKGSSELIAEVTTLFTCIKFPVVGMGILHWVDVTVSEPNFFKLNTDHTPLHLVLVDEIVSNHPLLHQKALELLVRLFENTYDELDVLVRLELKKMLLDRMLHLLHKGCVIPVVTFITKCVEDTDISLVRHFVTELLDMIAPPYTVEFVQLLLPLIENKAITDTLRTSDGKDPVSEFINHCQANVGQV